MKVVLMAGGKGTRISTIASDIPKPMIRVCGKPVLEREIECLKKQGYTDLIISVSHLGSVITNYFGDGARFGVRIEYYVEESPLGNAGALFKIKDRLSDEFILLNADALFDVDFNRFVDYHHKKGGLITLFTHPNSHPYDSGLILSNENGEVIKWLSKEDVRPKWYKNRVNAGLHVINKKILNFDTENEKVDLDAQLLKPYQNTGKMFAYDSPEYVKDMGTPDRFYDVCRDFENGIIQAKNLKRKQKAIFFDRDAIINKCVGFSGGVDGFGLCECAGMTIKKINASGYLAIGIVSQPTTAKGDDSLEQLYETNCKIETLLGNEGAYLDALYFCPHQSDKWHKGKTPETENECEFRMPKPGCLLKAAEDYNIDLSKSWAIGNCDNGVLANAANCRTIRIRKETELLEAVVKILESGDHL